MTSPKRDSATALSDLRSAAMRASDPKPGMHLQGIFCVTFWTRDGEAEPDHMDIVQTPPAEIGAQVRAVRHMVNEMPL